ncbi:hypothetical protein F4825DRAFT_404062 [Nemania diffusa]|nr:hypothetical protein F4825DRAFT_404062 [Nemania diffusa]
MADAAAGLLWMIYHTLPPLHASVYSILYSMPATTIDTSMSSLLSRLGIPKLDMREGLDLKPSKPTRLRWGCKRFQLELRTRQIATFISCAPGTYLTNTRRALSIPE